MTLKEILDEMRENTKNGDWEVAHHSADYLLTELVKELSRRESAATKSLVDEILAKYDDVGKWYA